MLTKAIQEMNRKSYISIVFILLAFASAKAQKADTLALLQNKIWTIEIPTKKVDISQKHHSNKHLAEDFIFEENHKDSKGTYYLSDTPESFFNIHKVGKKTCGKYIIVNSKKKDTDGKTFNEVSNYKILKLTQDTLKIQYFPTSMIL